MSFSPEKNPYRSTEGDVIDFSKKRLQFWTETVPPDIRRLEYDLYKKTRRNLNANIIGLTIRRNTEGLELSRRLRKNWIGPLGKTLEKVF